VIFIKYYNYEDLSIDSTKKPFNTHLWWVISASLWFMVDSTNRLVLLKSVDKGESWTTATTRSHKIQMGWNDGTYIWLVDCDNDGTADDFDVWKITTDGNDTITSIATSSGADANSVYVIDIFKMGSDVLVMNLEKRSTVDKIVVWDVDADPFVEKDTYNLPYDYVSHMWGIVHSHFANDNYLTIIGQDNAGTKHAQVFWYQHNVSTLGAGNTNTGWEIPTDINARGMAYDDANDIFMVLKKESDQLNYLCKVNIEVV